MILFENKHSISLKINMKTYKVVNSRILYLLVIYIDNNIFILGHENDIQLN